ncbi:MAG TPA: GNAT family N-acetyltransferase [Holophagaceae bacterium]|jgi:GNAT superfamily N-acetyltransferase|nr:GNAT family N-acetyltransferase [Holophagaceae bacterium]
MNQLDNIFWHSLAGPFAHWSEGTDRARRFARGFSPMLAFPDQAHPDFTDLVPLCDPEERFYSDGWSGSAPAGWRVEMESTMFKMVWDKPMPEADEAPEALPLGPRHVEAALELALLTKPGPFGLRTIELGEYFGLFEGERLIAMAGERLHAGMLREISGVCTHPDFQGRGLARRLMTKLLRREMARGEMPFLHVASGNPARALYARMGFKDYLESVVRIVSRAP